MFCWFREWPVVTTLTRVFWQTNWTTKQEMTETFYATRPHVRKLEWKDYQVFKALPKTWENSRDSTADIHSYCAPFYCRKSFFGKNGLVYILHPTSFLDVDLRTQTCNDFHVDSTMMRPAGLKRFNHLLTCSRTPDPALVLVFKVMCTEDISVILQNSTLPSSASDYRTSSLGTCRSCQDILSKRRRPPSPLPATADAAFVDERKKAKL